MAKNVEETIEQLLQQGKTKREIHRILSKDMAAEDFERFLRNHAELDVRQTYQTWNYLLLFVLGALTFVQLGRLLASIADQGVGNVIIAAWQFIVPAVNIYLLWSIYRFNRLGYLFLFVLGILTFLRPLFSSESFTLDGLAQTLPLVALSGFLYLRLFPKGGKNW